MTTVTRLDRREQTLRGANDGLGRVASDVRRLNPFAAIHPDDAILIREERRQVPQPVRREKLSRDPSSRGPDREPYGGLSLPSFGADQKEAGCVRASNQEHDSDDAQQQPGHQLHVLLALEVDGGGARGNQVTPRILPILSLCRGSLCRNRVELSLSSFQGYG